jgi:purine-nucleoside/S-methyl-5'-thioadenosine phosphorylase / adenosine deaminase
MIQSDLLAPVESISHGFFTRDGGVSTGIYAGRNCGLGSDDLRSHVIENRGRVADDLGVDRQKLLTVHQIHSAKVHTVTHPWERDAAPEADAMVTNQPGIGLGILTADCTPVLFADEQADVIGAAHAGWKGAFGGVLEATLEAMIELGASRNTIVAVVGPCISQANYEVGREFAENFVAKDQEYAAYFIDSARVGHHYFDLTKFTTDLLLAQGLSAVETLNKCTYADAQKYFSYRRTTHAGEPDYGRQISAISLREKP